MTLEQFTIIESVVAFAVIEAVVVLVWYYWERYPHMARGQTGDNNA